MVLKYISWPEEVCANAMTLPTASSVFLKTLVDSGITHAFVNWGSDHPALLADLDRQRHAHGFTGAKPTIVTCPNEMVALSAAQGYAQVTGKPALVIVHVDVGTQALAGAVHNVDRNRTPVIIYAGASPFSTEGEHKGSRNEWIMWLQDVPDQSSIVRQYVRYTSQLNSAMTIPGVVRRAVQIATSEPKGPVYLWARREVMEQELDPGLFNDITTSIGQQTWPAIEPAALSATATARIASALLTAHHPLIITSHLGRNPHAVSSLLALSTILAIPILPVCPSVVSVPHSHPFGLAPTFLAHAPGSHGQGLDQAHDCPEDVAHLSQADVIMVIDADLSWIPGNGQRPGDGARIFVLDGGDPLKTTVQMGWWRGEAEMICRADAEVALEQIMDTIRDVEGAAAIFHGEEVRRRAQALTHRWEHRLKAMDARGLDYTLSDGVSNGSQKGVRYTVPNIIRALREGIRDLTPSRGRRTLVLNETVSNLQVVWEHMRPEVPGNILCSGGSSLGWSLAAAVGASMGGVIVPLEESPTRKSSADMSGEGGHVKCKFDLIVVIVGDGSFMFGIPSSVYWMARRYNTPFLTIVLNNGGWKAPRLSMLALHPKGFDNEPVHADLLTTGFGPACPDYSQIAVAASAGWAWGAKVGGPVERDCHASEDTKPSGRHSDKHKDALDKVVLEGIRKVLEDKICAVIDCVLD